MKKSLGFLVMLILEFSVYNHHAVAQSTHLKTFVIEGQLIPLVFDDFERNTSITRYFVKDSKSDAFSELDLSGYSDPVIRKALYSKIKVTTDFDGKLVPAEELRNLNTEFDIPPYLPPPTLGERKVIVILVDFSDSPLDPHCTKQDIADRVFFRSDSTRAYYQEASFHQFDLPPDSDGDGSPDVFGPVTIEDTVTEECDVFSVMDGAEAAIQDSGVDLSIYDDHIFVTPSNSGCRNLGGGNRAWVQAQPQPFECLQIFPISHELGHAFNLHHASRDFDNDGEIDPGQEYGDYSDVMGACCLSHPHLNIVHKEQMHWFPESSSRIKSISGLQDQTYLIHASEFVPPSSTDTQGLRIDGKLFISTRFAVGFDEDIDIRGFPLFAGRTSIHRDGLGIYSRTLLLSTLGDGESFFDPVSGYSITQVGHSLESLSVEISVRTDLIHEDGFESKRE